MLQDIPNLCNPDPKVCKTAALNIIQHVSQNKVELSYLMKRLVHGLESIKVLTRTGCYTTLTVLLTLKKADPSELFDLMQEALVTSKESTKKERRLIYTARILCTGAILRTVSASSLSNNPELLRALLQELVELSSRKGSNFLLALPFLTHFFSDGTLTQDTFDQVWPIISKLWADKPKEGAKEGEETCSADEYACRVQLALVCKQYTSQEFSCLKDVIKICKAVLSSQLQFPDQLLTPLFKFLKSQEDEPNSIQQFFTTLLSSIKPTQFNLLCLCVEKCLQDDLIKPPVIVSKPLITVLLGVFKLHDADFTANSKKTIKALLNWDTSSKKKLKKVRKQAITSLFGGEPPNLLHEYKVLHPLIRTFMLKLEEGDLKHLYDIINEQLNSNSAKLSLRMGIVHLQVLGKIGSCSKIGEETWFEIAKRLLLISLGIEKINLKENEKDGEEKEAEEDQPITQKHEHLRKCAGEALRGLLSCTYKLPMMELMGEYLIENFKTLTTNENSLKVLKELKKKRKKLECNQHLKYIAWAYGITVLLDEGQVLSTSSDTLYSLLELAKSKLSAEGEENDGESSLIVELVKFTVDTVLREANPPFAFEEMFKRLMLEGKVTEDVIQVFADVMDLGDDEEGQGGEDGEDDSSSDEEEQEKENEEEKDQEEEGPPSKQPKLDEQISLSSLAEPMEQDSDQESIDLEDATEEDLKKMDGALAKVFATKKLVREEEKSGDRAMMRTLRLVESYVQRNIKCMSVSSLLLLLMPTVQLMKSSLKMKNKPQLTTRVIAVLDSLNRVKRFTGCDEVVEGTFASIAEELYAMAGKKSFRIFRELLEHSVVLVSRCYLMMKKKNKKEGKRLIALYLDSVDQCKKKLKRRKVRKGNKRGAKGNSNNDMSRFVNLALDAFRGNWKEGVKAIEGRIEEGRA